MKNRVAIIGNHPLTIGEAPYKDPTWEIWCQGSTVQHMPRWDRCIEIHDIEDLKKKYRGDPIAEPIFVDWWSKLKDAGPEKEIYLGETHPEVPRAKAYPKDLMLRHFGKDILWEGRLNGGTKGPPVRVRPAPFSATVCWSLAMAIHELSPKARRGKECMIGVYGVDMETEGEYRDQRAAVWYFMGVAAGRGIKLVVPEMSELLKSAGLYGFDETGEAQKMAQRIREYRKEFGETLDRLRAEGADDAAINRAVGAIQAFKFMEREMA